MIDLLVANIETNTSIQVQPDLVKGTFSSNGLSWERNTEITFKDIESLVQQQFPTDKEVAVLSSGFLKTETMAQLKQKGGKYHQLSKQYRDITNKYCVQKKATRDVCLAKFKPHVPEMLKTFQHLLFSTIIDYSYRHKEPFFFYGTYAFIRFYLSKLDQPVDIATNDIATNDIDCILINPEVVKTIFQALIYFAQNYMFVFGASHILVREISVTSGKYGALSSFKLKYECGGESCPHSHCVYTGVLLDCLLEPTPKYQIGLVQNGPFCQYQGLLCYVACMIDKFYNITEKPLSRQQILDGQEKVRQVLELVASLSLLPNMDEAQREYKVVKELLATEGVFQTPLAKSKFLEYLELLKDEDHEKILELFQ